MLRCAAKTKIVVLKSAAAQTYQELVHCLRWDSIYTPKMPWMVVWVGNYVAMNFMTAVTAACNRDGLYVFKLLCASMRVCMILHTKQWTWRTEAEDGWTRLTMLQWHDMEIYGTLILSELILATCIIIYWKFHPFVYWIHGNMKSC